MAGERNDLPEEEKRVKCPKCGHVLSVLLFMGEIPEFYTCPNCKMAFDPESMKAVAWIF